MTDNLKIPYGKTLYPFQIETIKKTLHFLRQNESHACYVANEQGTGKTPVGIVVSTMLECSRILVVCPSIARPVWEKEVYEWSKFDSSIPRVKVVTTSKDIQESKSFKWLIISYDLTIRLEVIQELKKQTFDLLISDEHHYCRNYKSKRAQTFFKHLWPLAANKLLLSGTPLVRVVTDMYPAFHAILPNEPTFKSFSIFAERYAYCRLTPWGPDWYGLKNAEELSKIMRSTFYIRYTKQEVLKDLPSKTYQMISLPEELSLKIQEKDREALIREQQKVILDINEGKVPVLTKSMAEHRRVQGELKIPSVLEFVLPLLEAGTPVVIFAWHKTCIALLAEGLKEFKPVIVTGETSLPSRAQAVTDFQEGATDCFLATIGSAGTAITLTRSSNVVFCELSWLPAEISQAASRCHRIGSKSAVNIYWFLVENSFDDKISQIVMRRAKEFDEVCNK
jgi:SWI/SNF-related matrix-associated actin-dependent regulator 1 of chromatin subfamily A